MWRKGTHESVSWEITCGNGAFSAVPDTGVPEYSADKDNKIPTDAQTTDSSGKKWSGKSIWFTASDVPGNVTIQANGSDEITFEVVPPSDWSLKLISTIGHPKAHPNGDISCVWYGKIYIHSNDVNFYRIQIREEDSVFIGQMPKGVGPKETTFEEGTRDNNWLRYSIGQSHGQGYVLQDNDNNIVSQWKSFDFHTDSDGSAMQEHDTVGIDVGLDNAPIPGQSPVNRPGYIYAPITFQWQVRYAANYHKFKTIDIGIEITLMSNGNLEVKKGGVTATTKFSDSWNGPELLKNIPGDND
jgi:hypothetical protein